MEKKILTKDEFADLMYRSFGDDIDRETWESLFDEMAEQFDKIG